MGSVERAWAVDANYRSCLAFFRVLHTRASVPSTPTRIAGSICPETPEWSKDGRPRFYRPRRRAGGEPTALAGSPTPLPGGQRPATDVAVKLNHVLPSQADASRGNEGASSRADVGAWSRRQP